MRGTKVGFKPEIALGLAFCGLLVLSSTAMGWSDEESPDLALGWDADAETVVAEARTDSMDRADPDLQEEKAGGGAPPEGGAPAGGGKKPDTGNDPRDFKGKFMPYWRAMSLENGMETWDFTLFGMWAMSSKFAMTYEIPVARYYDIRDTEACAGLPDEPCFGEIPFEGNPTTGNPLFPGLRTGAGEGDGEEAGLGDTILRLFWSPDRKFLGGAFIPGVDITVPTATKDILGGEQFILGPIFTFVWDNKFWPAPGSFFAMMNIFQFDVYGDTGRESVQRYLGRWFLQLPLEKKHKLYTLMEFQPVWDNEARHFSFWFGPEFGKAIAPGGGVFRNGGAFYVKPGVGISADANSGDRDWTIEIGFRYFFPSPRETYKMMKQKGGG